jgi:hypothetical protein
MVTVAQIFTMTGRPAKLATSKHRTTPQLGALAYWLNLVIAQIALLSKTLQAMRPLFLMPQAQVGPNGLY